VLQQVEQKLDKWKNFGYNYCRKKNKKEKKGMGKVSFTNLKLKTDTSVKTLTVNDLEIEVKQYLPIEDKYDLVTITLQEAEDNGIYDPVKTELYFNLNIVYMYTNISFTEKQKYNESKLYDILESNEIINQVINLIPVYEYEKLYSFLQDAIVYKMEYNNTTAAVLNKFINDLPKNAKIASDIVDNFDKEKYQEVINFATAANGGRNIVTNQ
jgi:hypothetical protein